MASIIYGYIRVSSKDQNEHRQIINLLDFGVPKNKIYLDKLSGKDFHRPSYQELVHKKLKKNDLLVVQSIDRLGRNYDEILSEWKFITKEVGADIKIIDMPLLDTAKNKDLIGTLISDIVLQLLSFIAENERTVIRQRQAEGIAAAKIRGVKFGRPPIPTPKNFGDIYCKWKTKEISCDTAIELTGLSKYAFYKKANEIKEKEVN